MKTTKLYRLLNTIETRELKALEHFLLSPYFTNKTEPIALFRELRPFHPIYQKVDKVQLYKKLRPKKAFDVHWLNDRYSELSRLVETFLQSQQLTRDEGLSGSVRCQAFRERGLHQSFFKECRSTIAFYTERQAIHPNTPLSLWELHHSIYRHPATPAKPDPFEEELKAMAYLDQYYITHQLSFVVNCLGGATARTIPLSEEWLSAILEKASRYQGENPLLAIYLQLIRLFREGCTLDKYLLATQQFMALASLLEKEEKAFLLVKLANLGSSQFTQGQMDYLPQLLPLYQYGLEEGLFLTNGILSEDLFLNICVLGAYANEPDWTRTFIETNEPFLKPAYSQETLALGKAYVAFHMGDFIAAHKLLNEVQSSRLVFKLRLNSLSVRCLLEATLANDSFYSPFKAKVDNFNKFIRRNHLLSAQRKQPYLLFAAMALKIARLHKKPDRNKADYLLLEQKISEMASIIFKSWLLAKLKQSRDSLEEQERWPSRKQKK
ncbi:MAG: hypothetical protein R2828_07820 [Saprospiraceae bacterium]